MLEIPKEIYTNIPKLTTIGFKEILIENYISISEYEECFAKIETYVGIIRISGINIKLDKMTEECLKITGDIEAINIERK